jgi:hypothetical protein
MVAGDRCGHPGLLRPAEIDRVTGDAMPQRRMLCWLARGFASYCGPEGQFWEPRETGFGDPDD